ncbi:MAG: Phosphoglycolate phosphatase [Phycisphaerae bacterium]|nr:Phosphoglycolate phosphatase [Phycisphaerae bacterium]
MDRIRSQIEAVIFDMDGTLTVPLLDFDAMRTEIGITDGSTLLEAMARMDPDARDRANDIILRHEAAAARDATLNPGAADLLAELSRRGVPVALLTRNSRASVRTVCDKFRLRFDAIHTREDGLPKPSPEPVLHLCRVMGRSPAATLVVGDYLYDIQSGRQAGCPTCLLVHGPRPAWADQADMVIKSLAQLLPRIELATRPG